MNLEAIDVEEKTFDVVRRGYDQMQVAEFLKKVGDAMARLEERIKIAEVRSEHLDRELREVRSRAEATIQETVLARAELIKAGADGSQPTGGGSTQTPSVELSNIEAQQIIEQATRHAAAIQAEAEAVLQGALSTSSKINEDRDELLGSVEAERLSLLAAATAEAEAIRNAAKEEAESARAHGAMRAREIRSDAEAEADAMIRRAEKRSSEIVAAAERTWSESVPGAATSSLESRVARGESTWVSGEEVAEHAEEDDSEEFAVDLREDPQPRSPEPVGRSSRTSRYKSRSANLPRLGNDATSVIGSLESLRSKE